LDTEKGKSSLTGDFENFVTLLHHLKKTQTNKICSSPMRVIVVQVLLNFIEREFQLTDISFLKALKVIKQKS